MELLPCPFCGGTPSYKRAEWKDDSRYVQAELNCCVTMTDGIGWRRARDMTEKQQNEMLLKDLSETWNKRYVPDPK